MYTITRTSKVPATAIRIQVDAPEVGSDDGGFQQGGVFEFAPAGQPGDTHQVGEHAAKAIMLDPTLAPQFECSPHLPRVKKDDRPPVPGEPVPETPADEEAADDGKATRKHAAGGKTAHGGKK